MNHMMIDIETLGVSRDSVILSAGLVVFNKDMIGYDSHLFLDVREQLQLGRTIDASTVKWWLLTDREAFSSLCMKGTLTLNDLKKELHFFYKTYDIKRVWSRGSMDLEILKGCFEVPWEFWQERDVRTLDEFGSMEASNRHDALGDCLNQIDFVQRIFLKGE